jgi:hypothetical protein
MRKKWMHRELEARKEPSPKDCQVGQGKTVDFQGATSSFLSRSLLTQSTRRTPAHASTTDARVNGSDNHFVNLCDHQTCYQPPSFAPLANSHTLSYHRFSHVIASAYFRGLTARLVRPAFTSFAFPQL